MSIREQKHSIWFRCISITLIITFFLSSTLPADALAPWMTSQVSQKREEILQELFKRGYHIIYAESEEDKELLKINETDALLLSDGRIIVSPEVAENDLNLIRCIFHEEIEAILQIMAEDDYSRYFGLQTIVLSDNELLKAYKKLLTPKQLKIIPKDLFINDLLAEAFELILLWEKELISFNEMTKNEQEFIKLITPIIMRHEYDYFTRVFWDDRKRREKIKVAIANDKIFHQVSSKKKNSQAIMELKERLRKTSQSLWDGLISFNYAIASSNMKSYTEDLRNFVTNTMAKSISEGKRMKLELETKIKKEATDRKDALDELGKKIEAVLERRDFSVVKITGRSGTGKTTISNVISTGIAKLMSKEILVIHCDQFYNSLYHINSLIQNRAILNKPLKDLTKNEYKVFYEIAKQIHMPWPSEERIEAKQTVHTFLNYYNTHRERQEGYRTTEIMREGVMKRSANVYTPMEELSHRQLLAIKKRARAYDIEELLESNMDKSLWKIYQMAEHDNFLDYIEESMPHDIPIKLFVAEGTYITQGQTIFNKEAKRFNSDISVFVEVDEETRRERIRRRGREEVERELIEMSLLDIVYASTVDTEREECDIVIDNNKETNDYQILEIVKGFKLQFGIPAETTKDMMGREMLGEGTVPDVFILPPELFYGGRNYADIEFLLYYNFFFKQGKRVTIVGTLQQIENIRKYVQYSLLGPKRNSQEFKSYHPEVQQFLKTASEEYAVRGKNGVLLDIDSYIDFIAFQNGTALVGKDETAFEIKELSGNKFSVSEIGDDENAEVINIDYRAPETHLPRINAKYKQILSNIHNQRFAVTPLGTSDGFDLGGDYTSFIVWLEGEGILVDPSPQALDYIDGLGIDEDAIPYVFLTHAHSDHDGGLLRKILMKRRIKLIASRPVFDSFIAKAQVLVGEESNVKDWVDYIEVNPGKKLNLRLPNGDEAQIETRWNLHPIPTNGFKIKYGNKTFGYSGDTEYNSEKIDKLEREKRITKKQADDLKYFFWDENKKPTVDLFLHEAGVPPIHTTIETLGKLTKPIKEKCLLVHTSDKNLTPEVKNETGLSKASAFKTYELLGSNLGAGARISDLALASMAISTGLSREQRLRIAQEAEEENFKKGDVIIQQGEKVGPDSKFYIILHGSVDVIKDGEQVWVLVSGDIFGEIALELNIPRTASIVAKSEIKVLSLDLEQYKKHISNNPEVRKMVVLLKENLDLLEQWISNTSEGLCSNLTTYALKHMATKLKKRKHHRGEKIIIEGDDGDELFIIKSGKVGVYTEMDGKRQKIASLNGGEYFGEIALLVDGTARTATVEAEGFVETVVLKKKDFDRIIRDFPGFEFSINTKARQRIHEKSQKAGKNKIDISPGAIIYPPFRRSVQYQDKSFPLTSEMENMLKNVLRQYHIGHVENLYVLKPGKIKDSIQVVLVQTKDDELYVLKINKERNYLPLDREVEWVKFLKKQGFPYYIPEPVLSKNDEGRVNYAGKSFILYPYFSYQDGREKPFDLKTLHELGRMTSEYHRCIKGFAPETNNITMSAIRSFLINFANPQENLDDLSQKRMKFSDWAKNNNDKNSARKWFLDDSNWGFISKQFHELKETLSEDIYEKLPKLFIHGDLHPGNFLYDNDKIRVLIDPDLSRFESRLYDLTGAIYQIMRSKNIADPIMLWSEVIYAYQASLPEDDGLSDNEIKYLSEFMRAGLLYHFLFLAKGLNDRNEELYVNTEKGANKTQNHLIRLMEILKEMDAYEKWSEIHERLKRIDKAKKALFLEINKMKMKATSHCL